MQRLETRIAALEAATKSQPSPRFAADVVEGFREILAPLGLEVPDALPGELSADWMARISNEALQAVMRHVDSLY
jgi:hypothetical protein